MSPPIQKNDNPYAPPRPRDNTYFMDSCGMVCPAAYDVTVAGYPVDRLITGEEDEYLAAAVPGKTIRAGPIGELVNTIPDSDIVFMAIDPKDPRRSVISFFDYLTTLRYIEDAETAKAEYARRYGTAEE